MGIVSLEGEFWENEIVLMKSSEDKEEIIGKGIVRYNAKELAKLLEEQSKSAHLVIHRDNLVIEN